MNVEYFIAKRIIRSKAHKSSASSPIIKIGITAIALGIIVMLVAVATGTGLQQKIREKIAALNGHIIITYYDTNESDDAQKPFSKDRDIFSKLSAMDGIRHMQAAATKGGIIRTETDFEGVVVKGVGMDFDWQYFGEFLTEGQLPDYSDRLNAEILLSSYLANRLQLKVGDKVTTWFLNEGLEKDPRPVGFDLIGIYNSGLHEFDRSHLIADIRHIRRLNRWEADEVGAVEIFIDHFNKLDGIGQEVYYEIDGDLDAETIAEKYISIFEWVKLFDFNILLIIWLMIAVAGINMVTALLVLILERTNMIGILKALGSSNRSVQKIFLYNAMYLVGLGLLWGNAIGLGLLLAQQYFGFIPLDPDTYYVSEVPILLNPWLVLTLNAGTALACLLMLLGPSFIISRITPVKAIRFE